MRVLITKLKVTHQAESSLYMKAVRATLILVPLLGIQYVLLPYKPEGRVSSEIYDYIMHILMHYQVRPRSAGRREALSCEVFCQHLRVPHAISRVSVVARWLLATSIFKKT